MHWVFQWEFHMIYVGQFFGSDFLKIEKRIESYEFIENFISDEHVDWTTTLNTSFVVKRFINKISKMSNQEFSFLLTHSGYIPETYEADSSQESIYSKLIETLVLEWSRRVGFENSILPTQKSSMEDVSILDDKNVIVCDAKSFRLGRSQSAPNVKDVLKHADIEKWLSAHKHHKRLGGLITFPSQHDWKRGSDYYQYLTDKTLPTISLYYEHLAYILLFELDKNKIIDAYVNYGDIFPSKINKNNNNREVYYDKIHEYIFLGGNSKWNDFNSSAQKIINEKVFHTVDVLNNHIKCVKDLIVEKYKEEADIEVLREKAIQAEHSKATEQLSKQKNRIYNFRTVASGYYEK